MRPRAQIAWLAALSALAWTVLLVWVLRERFPAEQSLALSTAVDVALAPGELLVLAAGSLPLEQRRLLLAAFPAVELDGAAAAALDWDSLPGALFAGGPGSWPDATHAISEHAGLRLARRPGSGRFPNLIGQLLGQAGALSVAGQVCTQRHVDGGLQCPGGLVVAPGLHRLGGLERLALELPASAQPLDLRLTWPTAVASLTLCLQPPPGADAGEWRAGGEAPAAWPAGQGCVEVARPDAGHTTSQWSVSGPRRWLWGKFNEVQMVQTESQRGPASRPGIDEPTKVQPEAGQAATVTEPLP